MSGELAKQLDGMPYYIYRCDRSGVFAGFLEKRWGQNERNARILQCRRVWYWEGAATLSELAVNGTCKPDTCKFPIEVPFIEVTDCLEYIAVTQKAKDSIAAVPIWTAEKEE